MKIAVLLLLFTGLIGCSPNGSSGPPSANETSASRPQIKERVKFIEQYVTFRRAYDELEYDMFYQNNGGGMVP
ncbi:MAG: hypothetical protein WBG32_03310, partial [Nodosilinea sp.]